MHVFPFSARPKTPAARMPQLDRGLVRERAAILRNKASERLTGHLKDQQDKVFEVLIERSSLGRTPGFTEIEIAGERLGQGAIVKARATGLANSRLIGERLSP
jgi:threonylcarbamoyladenosine tRNA methylthiotransferase MtaB